MNRISINYLGTTVNILSENTGFINYAKKYFDSTEEDICTESRIEVKISLRPFYSMKKNKIRPTNMSCLFGEHAGIDNDGSYVFCYNELLIKLAYKPNNWNASCYFQKNFLKHLANVLLFKGTKTSEHYYRLICRMVIQNLIFIQIRILGGAILSAAAININGKAIVFAGLPGSGKTTLVTLIKHIVPKSVILAENYVVIKDGLVRSFTEGKSVSSNSGYPMSEIYIIQQAEHYSVRELSFDEGLKMLRGVNQFTAELPEHSPYLGIIFDMCKFENAFFSDNLDKMLSGTRLLQLSSDWGLVAVRSSFLEKYGKDITNN